jgi:hypothetical protein
MEHLFEGLAHTPHQHFTLYFYAAVLRVIAQTSLHFGSAAAANERLPFLAGYFDEIASRGVPGESLFEVYANWRQAIDAWERRARVRLPLADLRAAASLEHDELVLLAQIGLPDEDPRFGLAFDAMQNGIGEPRAGLSTLAAGWRSDAAIDARAAVHRLHSLGLVEPLAGSATLRVNSSTWDAVRGSAIVSTTGWAQFVRPEALPDFESLVLPDRLVTDCARLQRALAAGTVKTVILRGPRHNGRRTLAGAIARALGQGMLEVSEPDARDGRWSAASTLACLLNAVVVVAGDPAPSESFELPPVSEALAPLFVTLPSSGGIGGRRADSAVTLRLPIPDRDARERLWNGTLGGPGSGLTSLRMTSGNIIRAARIANASSIVNEGEPVDDAVLRAAVRTLDRPGLEALTQRVEASGDWSQLAVSSETLRELTTLTARCRQRERLAAFVGEGFGGLGPGVRALFKGPSGTGKTLAARILASALGMDLYRVDLSAVVNKYIGETEKNLERVFARAEELDVILLLDEGDALLTQRTGVQTANDRYANLETNYLLQRLESYEGILVITTNAGERIDTAFQRRMDVVIDFSLPDASERWAIWQLHLPPAHEVDLEVLHAAVQRCALSGAQIRNVALHASLLAVESESPLTSVHFEAAVDREYRKQGAVSPLRVRIGAR